jgi:hypothetical protein
MSVECWCGSTSGKHGEAPRTDCRSCAQSTRPQLGQYACGGALRNSVYRVLPSATPHPPDLVVLPLHAAPELDTPVSALRVHYIGCYVDKVADRDLPVLVSVSARDVMGDGFGFRAQQLCMSGCLRAGVSGSGAMYAGLQAGSECHCGRAYGKHGRADDDDYCAWCRNGGGRCGANGYSAIYKLDDNDEHLSAHSYLQHEWTFGTPMRAVAVACVTIDLSGSGTTLAREPASAHGATALARSPGLCLEACVSVARTRAYMHAASKCYCAHVGVCV